MLQSTPTGTRAPTFTWHEFVTGDPDLTDEERPNIMRQVGGFTRQLTKIRFSQIGSVFAEEEEDGDGNTFTIGPCLSPAFTRNGRGLLKSLDRGPFDTTQEYLEALATTMSEHAQHLPMNYNTHVVLAPMPREEDYGDQFDRRFNDALDRRRDFTKLGDKANHSRSRFGYCLKADVLKEVVVPCLVEDEDGGDINNKKGFYLMHPDLAANSLYVDEDCNVTCVTVGVERQQFRWLNGWRCRGCGMSILGHRLTWLVLFEVWPILGERQIPFGPRQN